MCLRDTGVKYRSAYSHDFRMIKVLSPSRRALKFAAICALSAASLAVCPIASGQTSGQMSQAQTAWKPVAGTTINEGLAGPASGSVSAIWYTAGGSSLLAQTESGRIFETSDFVHWRLNTTIAAPPGANT